MSNPEINFNDLHVKDFIERINPSFFEWIKKILELNVSRALQISTYFTNFYIVQNYFPSFSSLLELMPELVKKKKLTHEKMKEFRVNFERIFTLFILVLLKYDWNEKLSQDETDKSLNDLESEGSLINSFFIFNANPVNLKIKKLRKYYENYFIIEHLLPNLDFDPEFRKVLRSDAIKHLFFTTTPANLLNPNGNVEKFKYYAEPNYLLKIQEVRKDYGKKIFNIDPDLKLSNSTLEFMNYFGIFDFGSFKLIDDLISLFTEYYTTRVPSKRTEIQKNLLCFGELLKLAEGKTFQKLRYNTLKKKLSIKFSKKDVIAFLRHFCYSSRHQSFDLKFKDFNAKKFLRDYHEFLGYCCYKDSGIVYFGVYLIWRALIKYFENLQREKEFQNTKGTLLENWSLGKAQEFGFQAEKIILINPKNKPTEKYLKMKEQIKSFPREPIELKAEFPIENKKSYFREIDLAIRIKNHLLIFECKGTSAPIGEAGKLYYWGSYFEEQMHLLANKSDIIYYNIKNNIINHPFLNGVEIIVFQLIKTEGLLAHYAVMFPHEFINHLKNLREHIEKKTIEEYLEKSLKDFSLDS